MIYTILKSIFPSYYEFLQQMILLFYHSAIQVFMRAIVSVHNLHNLKAHQNIYSSSSCEIYSVHVQPALLSCLLSINCNNINL